MTWEPSREAADAWELQCETWRLHARTRGHLAKVDDALRVLDKADRMLSRRNCSLQNLIISCSGGKDSVAMAALVYGYGIKAAGVHATAGALDIPGSRETASATWTRLGISRNKEGIGPDGTLAAAVVFSTQERLLEHCLLIAGRFKRSVQAKRGQQLTELDLLKQFPPDTDITDRGNLDLVWRCCSGGDLLNRWMADRSRPGSFTGLRAEESKGRRANAIFHGDVYQAEGTLGAPRWMVNPLSWWTADDVMAYLLINQLPLHPFYKRAWCYFGGKRKIQHLRVGAMLADGWISANGGMTASYVLYPDQWRAIEAIRPELARYR